MQENKTYQYLEAYSLTPSRLSVFRRKTFPQGHIESQPLSLSRDEKNTILANLHGGEYTKELRFHNFQISEQARKSMQLKINWLYFMAKKKKKKSLSGKEIHNFKMNFITLTLASDQKHPTAEITSKIFNQFLTEIRQKYQITNFVWRLEFQKNGNVHYHIVTDCYTDYHIVNKIWNRCQDKLGYVQAYAKKHSMMSFSQYVASNPHNAKTDFQVLKKRYSFGRASNWQMPNSSDVKSVSNGKAINLYISKYFSKKQNAHNACNPLDNKENSLGMRLWFCSRSLSKMKTISDYVESTGQDLFFIISTAKDTFKVVHDFCTSYFYSFSNLWAEAKGFVHKMLYSYAISTGYEPST